MTYASYARKPRFQPFEDAAGRWRLVAGNGEKVATSGESFASRGNAVRAARLVRALAREAEVEDF